MCREGELTLININEAIDIIIDNTENISMEEIKIISCKNRVLVEDIYSNDNLPPFNKSAMDGYAIKGEDTSNIDKDNIKGLEIRKLIKAGDWCEDVLMNGEAFKIMTGAPLPQGANSVIKVEKTTEQNNVVYIKDKVKQWANVIRLGEEIRAGDIALKKGTLIRPAEIGLLASLGYPKVKVYRNPVVGLIITGDELIDIDSKLEKGKIRNSNEYTLTSLIENCGVKALSFGIIKDSRSSILKTVNKALETADIIITSGGVSVGDYDFIEDVLIHIGAKIRFNSVGIKPGKPITFATYNKKLIFGLPGNPLSIITTFEEFVKPAIRKFMGKRELFSNEFDVVLANDFKCTLGKRDFVYVDLKKKNGVYYAYKIGIQSSNQLMNLTKCNGLIVISEEREFVSEGETVHGRFLFE